MPPDLQRWIVVIGGFTQSRCSSGLFAIWRELLRRNHCSQTLVTNHTWDDDWDGWASVISSALWMSPDPAPVDIVAYSWGVDGALRLARALKALGVRVRVIVSCDGVARPLARWRALWSPILSLFVGEPQLSVPANVQRVVYLRQRTNRPRGHAFVCENGTVLDDQGYLPRGWTHQDADNSKEFHQLVLETCG